MKIFFGLLLVAVATSHTMEPDAQHAQAPALESIPAKQEIGFKTQHYKDVVECYYDGKESQESADFYVNFCLRDKMWILYLEFLKDKGSHVIDIFEKPTSDSIHVFQFAKVKLQELHAKLGQNLELFELLQEEHEAKMHKLKKNKKAKKTQ